MKMRSAKSVMCLIQLLKRKYKGTVTHFDDLVPKGLANHISHLFNSIGQWISAIMPVIDNLSSALGDLFKPL